MAGGSGPAKIHLFEWPQKLLHEKKSVAPSLDYDHWPFFHKSAKFGKCVALIGIFDFDLLKGLGKYNLKSSKKKIKNQFCPGKLANSRQVFFW